jgi:hypothetical protein
MNLKIALLLSGHTRSLGHTLDSLNKVVAATSAHVFIHTWCSPDMQEKTWRSPENYSPVLCTKDALNAALKPAAIVIEDSCSISLGSIFDNTNNRSEIKPTGAHFMIYGMAKVFQLCEEYSQSRSIKFDVVIRYRFDLLCLDPQQVLNDCIRVAQLSDGLLMVSHNWATAVGSFFDGYIVSTQNLYLRFINSCLSRFNRHCQRLTLGEPFIAELIICNVARDAGLTICKARAELQIIRSDGNPEQLFSSVKTNAISVIKSSCAICMILKKLGPDKQNSYLMESWRNHSGLFVRVMVWFFYPIYKKMIIFFKHFVRIGVG